MATYTLRFFDMHDERDERAEYVKVQAKDLDELSDLIDDVLWKQNDRETRFGGVEW